MSEELDLGLGVLDHQLLDCDGRRCGNVDDLAIEGGPGQSAIVVALYSGPGAWRGRSRVLGRLAARLGGGRVGRGDDRLRPLVARIPGADR